jgi:phage tail sheath protein FI
MAEQIVSPGVFTRENDQSLITSQPVEAGSALVGPTVKGPVGIPTIVTSYSDFKNKFGSTIISGGVNYTYLTSISAYNYFNQGGDTLLITRAVSGSFTSATSPITNANVDAAGTKASTGVLAGVTSSITASNEGIRLTIDGGVTNFFFVSNSAAQDVPSLNLYYFDGSATALATEINTNGSTYFSASTDGGNITIFDAEAGTGGNSYQLFSGSLSTLLNEEEINSASFTGGTDAVNATAFTLATIAKGDIQNSTGSLDANGVLESGSKDNLRIEISSQDTSSGTFNLLVRRGNDSTREKVVLEQYNNISLDPEADNYIEKAIGNQYKQIATDDAGNPYIQVVGDYPNISNLVYVQSVASTTPSYLDAQGAISNQSFTASIPTVQSESFSSATGANFGDDARFYDNINSTNTQGLSPSDYTQSLAILANKDQYLYNVITIPGVIDGLTGHASVITDVITKQEERTDAITVVDLASYSENKNQAITRAGARNSSYAATYWPWLQTKDPDTGKLVWVPASTLIPSVYAFNDKTSETWFAPAGLNRGSLPTVVRAKQNLQRADRDVLYNANVNPIATFPNTGVVVFGQKTLQKAATALDRINVRRLLISVKSFISQVSQNLVFEQNSLATRNNFLTQVNPFLESVQQKQGLYAFRVVMDETNNTPDVIDRNQLVGQLFLQPTKTAEFIILDFNVLPTGAEFPV